MKKFIVMLLALCMLLSTTALAAEGDAISLCGYHGDTSSQYRTVAHDPGKDIISLNAGAIRDVAVKFTTDKPFTNFQVLGCTCGQPSGSTFDLAIYVWDTDYNTTLYAGAPVAVVKGVIVTDNGTCNAFTDNLPAGTYLAVLYNPSVSNSSVGFWQLSIGNPCDYAEYYKNGQLVEGAELEAQLIEGY